MYHIRIDYFDNKIKVVRTFFEYDYPSKENVVNDVLLPYLQERSFIFGGAKVEDEGIRKVEIYETDSSIDKTVERVNGTASPMMAFIPYTRERYPRYRLDDPYRACQSLRERYETCDAEGFRFSIRY